MDQQTLENSETSESTRIPIAVEGQNEREIPVSTEILSPEVERLRKEIFIQMGEIFGIERSIQIYKNTTQNTSNPEELINALQHYKAVEQEKLDQLKKQLTALNPESPQTQQ